ncbi:RNA 2',3'-cyclic phosphodiesterase [Haliea sp. E17]|uniref:RNA 2',3'-cyclic phosphodiesterase n=1 Tax=Haliea sp. E17 TaxID=3401576 RepID=UPI003AAF0D19
MRLFFALDIPGPLALDIATWREQQLPLLGRPVPAANFHITLAFLGEIPDSRLDALCQDVDAAAEKLAPAAFELQLDQVGYWPRPGIYWLGPASWPDSLEHLARKLGGIGAIHGHEKRREHFQAHVTLFRGCEAAPPAPALAPDFRLSCSEFLLMESRQGKRGVSYHPVAGWELGTGFNPA